MPTFLRMLALLLVCSCAPQVPPPAPAAAPVVSTPAPAPAPTAVPPAPKPIAPAEPAADVPLPTPPADQRFTWPDIQAQMAYGLATNLRNYSITEAQWTRAVKGYQTKAIATIATRKYATPALLEALRDVPRPFLAYDYEAGQHRVNILEDYETIIDLGYGATMSAPSIQAFMTANMKPTKDMVALEVGTGSGAQAILLSRLVKQVYTIEVRQALGEKVGKLLGALGYDNIETKIGDGYYGWKEKAPFDLIIVTCQSSHIPPALVEQLKPEGVMVIPVGPAWSKNQQMLKVWKDPSTGKVVSQRLLAKTFFIPMLKPEQVKN